MGRSLSAVRDNRHRYKVRNGKLPTFGNPAGPVLEKRFGVGAAARRVRQNDENERVVRTKPMKTEMVAEETAKVTNAFATGRWTLKANPFKSARPAVPRETVQGELSLDKVKPVRNDLSDSDLELAKVKRADPETNSVKVESMEIPIVKAQPLVARMLALFQRRN